MQHRKTCPVEEAFAFGALAGRESLPVAGAQRLPGDAGDIGEQHAGAGLHTDDFNGGNRQGVGVVVGVQPLPQLGAVAVDRVSHDPLDGQVSRLNPLEHVDAECGFGGKAEVSRDVSGLAAWQISTPVVGQIQRTVDEAMTQRRDVREKDADLTVFDLAGAATILRGDPCRMGAAFGKAAFIHDEDRIERLGVGTSGNQGRWRERLADEGAQRIADGLLIPDGVGEQALHAGGMGLVGVFSDLPAVFAGDLAEDGMQIEQGLLMNFGTGKEGTQPGMQLAQLLRPRADLLQRWLGRFGCAILRRLHAGLAFARGRTAEGMILLACHIGASMARSLGQFPEDSGESSVQSPGRHMALGSRRIPGRIPGNMPCFLSVTVVCNRNRQSHADYG